MSRTTSKTDGSNEPRILDDNPTNWFVQFPDGSTELVTKSKLNRLLFEHDLWGILRTGGTVWRHREDGGPDITLEPNEDATEYTFTVGGGDPVHLGAHHKSDLVDAMFAMYNGESRVPEALVALYEEIRSAQVRREVVNAFAGLPPLADNVEVLDDGWLIYGHLLLTLEGEFYHPNTTSRNRSGSVVEAGSREEAYKPNIDRASSAFDREVEVGGRTYRPTDGELDFLARALWAVANAPEEV